MCGSFHSLKAVTLALTLGFGSLAVAQPANAGGIRIGIGVGGYYAPPPVVYQPAYCPPAVAYAPAPAYYYAPAPTYYYAQPVAVAPPVYYSPPVYASPFASFGLSFGYRGGYYGGYRGGYHGGYHGGWGHR